MSNLEKKVREVISACNHALCDNALHISITYNSKDVVECVGKMTDEEWTAWTQQPSQLRSIYYTLMTQPTNTYTRDLLNFQFQFNIERDTKKVANIFAEA